MATDVQQAENQTFDYFQKRQDAYARAMKSWLELWADWVNAFTPSDTAEPRPFGANAIVDRFYDTWEEVLGAQRKFAHSVIDVNTSAFQDSEEATREDREEGLEVDG